MTTDEMFKKVTPKLDGVREGIDRIDRQGGHTFVYRKLFGEAEFNYNLAKTGRGVHNIDYTEELLESANRRLDEATKQLAKRKQEISLGKMEAPKASK